MSLTRMKNSIMKIATEYGDVSYGDFSGTKEGKYGRLTPSIRKRCSRIHAACTELVAEGKLEEIGDAKWALVGIKAAK